jgi:NAD(P)-dependent dehydrogenase (short-subunit alcohol dehydrogenase family)
VALSVVYSRDSKHAAIGLMRSVASEVAGSGVTANAVCPSFVRTDMTRASVARIVEKTGRSEQEAQHALAFRLRHLSVRKLLRDLNRPPVPLVGQQIPDLPQRVSAYPSS